MLSCNSEIARKKKNTSVFSCKKGINFFFYERQITIHFTVYTSIQLSAIPSQSIDPFTVFHVSPCFGSYERPGAEEMSPSLRMSPCTRCIHKERLRKFLFGFEDDDQILSFAG